MGLVTMTQPLRLGIYADSLGNATPIEVFFQCFQGFAREIKTAPVNPQLSMGATGKVYGPSPSIAVNSDSERMGTPRVRAFSSFDPASVPATR